MREGDQCAARTERSLGKCVVGPVLNELYVGEALRRCESGARVDHAHAVAGDHRHLCKGLRNMHSAGDRQLERRIEHREKPYTPLDFDGGAIVRSGGFGAGRTQRRRVGGRIDEAFFARIEIDCARSHGRLFRCI